MELFHYKIVISKHYRWHYSSVINPTIVIEQDLATQVEDTKLLGLTVDSCLTWNKYCEKTISKLNSELFMRFAEFHKSAQIKL